MAVALFWTIARRSALQNHVRARVRVDVREQGSSFREIEEDDMSTHSATSACPTMTTQSSYTLLEKI